MSNQWNRSHLKNIARMLADRKDLQPGTYEEDYHPDLDLAPAAV
jgi:hypothetical protein